MASFEGWNWPIRQAAGTISCPVVQSRKHKVSDRLIVFQVKCKQYIKRWLRPLSSLVIRALPPGTPSFAGLGSLVRQGYTSMNAVKFEVLPFYPGYP